MKLAVRAAPGLPGCVTGDQSCRHRQPGPRICRQVLLLHPVGRFGVASGDRNAAPPTAGPLSGPCNRTRPPGGHAVIVRGAPGQPHLLADRWRGAGWLGPGDSGRLVGDYRQVPAGQLRPVPAHRQPAAGTSGPGRPGSCPRRGRLNASHWPSKASNGVPAAAGHTGGKVRPGRHRDGCSPGLRGTAARRPVYAGGVIHA